MHNIDYLDLDDSIKRIVGKWWRKWIKTESQASSLVSGNGMQADDDEDDEDELDEGGSEKGMEADVEDEAGGDDSRDTIKLGKSHDEDVAMVKEEDVDEGVVAGFQESITTIRDGSQAVCLFDTSCDVYNVSFFLIFFILSVTRRSCNLHVVPFHHGRGVSSTSIYTM